jgi:hypothetical protein
MSHASPPVSDKGAAFAGLIGGAIFIACVVYALVVWTNARFAGHAEEGEADHAARAAVTAPFLG